MRFSEDKLDKLTCSDGVQRPIHIWQPESPKAVILAIHGGMAHAGDYVTPALYFRPHGIATVSFDMHGHDGKKRVDIPGFDTFLSDAGLLLQWIKSQYPGLPIFVMGHSMGALIATHLALGRFNNDADIRGFILSSPYYVNAVKVPKIMLALSGVLAALFPTAKVPMEPVTDVLTHDKEITARHYTDEKDNIRASEASFRFATSLLKAQSALQGGLSSVRHPVFAVVAGDDKLANPQASQTLLATIPAALLEFHYYPKNFHENFNEENRETIFANVLKWMGKQVALA
ncbi:alpha/beta fold hydrolase [Curvibacter sp. APW13]|uniref:alpha/beta fold hydrolase n=1 Tax=Curvibacter sp. APW13 TaxID=3077236 RepID=UPI0028E05C76|nr:alpha/beta fold hydrolase [Curvibacter sp. APW13]MDT8991748.1 alpha/beta fold hydrolase [Curvibacter sp. APW13]